MSDKDLPIDVYVAAYSDAGAAQEDWDALKQLSSDKLISLEALLLVERDVEGKIHVKDNGHQAGFGAAGGAAAGALIGLIFPPALLASAAVGAGVGAATGAVVKQIGQHQIKSDIEDTLPPGSSGIVAVFDERWIAEVEKALAKAEKSQRHHAHADEKEES